MPNLLDIDTDSAAWRMVVLQPPIRAEGHSCHTCPIKHQCYINDAGRLPCEGLSVKEVCFADVQGTLDETVWWYRLPSNAHAPQVLRWSGAPDKTIREVEQWLKIQADARAEREGAIYG